MRSRSVTGAASTNFQPESAAASRSALWYPVDDSSAIVPARGASRRTVSRTRPYGSSCSSHPGASAMTL